MGQVVWADLYPSLVAVSRLGIGLGAQNIAGQMDPSRHKFQTRYTRSWVVSIDTKET